VGKPRPRRWRAPDDPADVAFLLPRPLARMPAHPDQGRGQEVTGGGMLAAGDGADGPGEELRLRQSFRRHTAGVHVRPSAARRRHRPAPRYPRAALDPGTGTGTTDQPEHWRDTGKLRASISAPGLLARVYKCVTLPKSTGSKTG
jgi:hypothetical protein